VALGWQVGDRMGVAATSRYRGKSIAPTSIMTQWPWAGEWVIEWAWLRLPGIGGKSLAPTSRMTQWPWAAEWVIKWVIEWVMEWAWLRLPGIGGRSKAPTSKMTE
jgi:hypothetical protein